MFSKALFKQSCKANGVMWTIITVANCFMLACVMMISGSGNIGNVATNVEDTIITKEIDSAISKRGVSYYSLGTQAQGLYDTYFVADYSSDYPKVESYSEEFATWLSTMPNASSYQPTESYSQALQTWKNNMPAANDIQSQSYALLMSNWLNNQPSSTDYTSTEAYTNALITWNNAKPTVKDATSTSAQVNAATDLNTYICDEALKEDSSYTSDSSVTKERLGAAMYAINPLHQFDSFYTSNNESVPSDYDVSSLLTHIESNDIETYLSSTERVTYRQDRSKNSSSIFLASNMTNETVISQLLDSLSRYGVTEEKYESFNYTYASVKHSGMTTIVSYQARYDYEYSLLEDEYKNGTFASEDAFKAAVSDMDTSLKSELTSSLLSSLPSEVSDALEEVGQMDLYGLIVGSIFFKMAGLLLPIIYMIMASNNLIAGQVDSGSMAYVLSTSTKRKTVVFTQAIYLIGSLLAMYICSTITSCICFSLVNVYNTDLTYAKLVLINLGSFLTLFAMSGICFLASCWFDRSKYSMALGGGLSMFFLVCTMLGLFGSKVIPSVVRFDALNYFNYVSLISLFDVVSIINGTTDFIWKLAILVGVGLIGYFVGGYKFEKKDLPL